MSDQGQQQQHDEDRGGSMFGTLMASRPRRERGEALSSTIGSIAIHSLIIAGLVYATANVSATPAPDVLTRVISLAPPPVPVAPPPPMQDVEVPPAVGPIARGFQMVPDLDIVPPVIPPPQVGVIIRPEDFSAVGARDGRGDGDSTIVDDGTADLIIAPRFVPMSSPPKLKNEDEVRRSITRNYPPLMRDAGIGGTTVMWFYVDENGRVVRHQVFKSSGHAALDEAASRVAREMIFVPAQNQDLTIPVWVQVPIVFMIR